MKYILFFSAYILIMTVIPLGSLAKEIGEGEKRADNVCQLIGEIELKYDDWNRYKLKKPRVELKIFNSSSTPIRTI